MLFSSSIFLFLFLTSLLFFYFIVFRTRKNRNLLLLFYSLFFYAWGEPKFVFVMLFTISINWFAALLIDKNSHNPSKAKVFLILSLLINFSIMFFFKYFNFTIVNINSLLNTDLVFPKIILPIGISFFTFQSVSYVIDVYKKTVPVQKNPLYVALYVSLFPQLIAGPIVRYETIAQEIEERKETRKDVDEGIQRFVFGLGKKVLLANNMALVADLVFNSNIETMSVSFAWLGAFAYTFQIYFDFSGYSDMAIGLGRIFGFHFLENFNFPYTSKSITEFWRRWHISLSTWFRDYVYFPMGGSRVESKRKLIFNLAVVWLLTGLWHGANWTFIIWGLWYFVLITGEKLLGYDKKLGLFSHVYTLFFVILGWVIFRSSDLNSAFMTIKIMLGLNGAPLLSDQASSTLMSYLIFFILSIYFSYPKKSLLTRHSKWSLMYRLLYFLFFAIVLLFSISSIINNNYNPFIYFNF